MATYKSHHNPVLLDDRDLLREQVKRDMFDGQESPSYIVWSSLNSTIDPYTEEVTENESPVMFPASGIIGRVAENDVLLDGAGRVRQGDVTILYPYDSISGVYLNATIKKVVLVANAASGVYTVAGQAIETIANTPIFAKFALQLLPNG